MLHAHSEKVKVIKVNFEKSKILGGIGALMIVLEVIPTAIGIFADFSTYGILRIMGILFILISLHNFANFYQAKNIYRNAKFGATAAIISTIFTVTGGIVLSAITGSATYLIGLLLYWGIFAITIAVAAFFVRRSLNELAACSATPQFATAGRFLYLGAILLILVLPMALMWVAFLILAYAFFKMKQTKPTTTPLQTQTPTQTNYV